ncbi:histidine kinase [Actinoplanes sp. NBRC 101535]|uniref:sensor histidine kinase n=1 Tax=Actinoplanes sp. NBRC 101535 TaxID=3032196 RepID=UPI0024A4A530|nr:histidine kinase [Actinoplanes sp. NBRC 101535]GLY05072.1 hypothetical protein Acsp01_54510 [Actinoplanes sp. NBRC 101535]
MAGLRAGLRAGTARLRAAGGWRLAYETVLVLAVTGQSLISVIVVPVHALAPWLIGVMTPAAVLSRRRLPLPAYAAAALTGLVTGGQGWVSLLVMSASLAYQAARWWQVAAGLALGAACFAGGSWWWEERPDLLSLILLTAAFTLVAVIPAGVARVVRRRRVLMSAMHRRNLQLHSQQGEVARQARARERTRIARDLHDSLGHKLTLISLYASMPEQDPAMLRETSAAAMTELRQILGLLGQDEQATAPSLDRLDDLADQARASGTPVEILREGTARPLSPLIEHAAYRVIQEGLTNALRHAHGSRVVLSLRYEPDAVIAGVTNTAGRPVVRHTSGQGLLGLTERIRVAHGVLYHGPTPDGGFRLAATLPYANGGTGPAAVPPPVPDGPDFADLVARDRRRSRFVLITATVGAAGVLTVCCAGLWASTRFASVDRELYDTIGVGRPEPEVRDLLPDPDTAIIGATGGREVPGATCVDYEGSILEQLEEETETGTTRVYRFCFRNGALVDKQEFLDRR